MTPMFIYAGFVILVAMPTMILFRAKQALPALIVGTAGVFGVILRVAQEAYDAIEASGRMEPVAALLGAGVISIMTGIGLADLICDYLSKELGKR